MLARSSAGVGPSPLFDKFVYVDPEKEALGLMQCLQDVNLRRISRGVNRVAHQVSLSGKGVRSMVR